MLGPVLSIIPFEDEDEAIAIGKDVIFGLVSNRMTCCFAKEHLRMR